MDDVFERAQALAARWDERVRAELPPGAELFDAHTHLGHDIDGMVGDRDELLGHLERYGISGAFMFCLDEPDRHPAFRAANDRTLAHAELSDGRLVPFVRLDLAEGPVEEARRCLDRGARGIKLHPRAQKFLLNDDRLAPIFELAAERRVPILIHGGRGLPPIAAGLSALVDRYDGVQLIIAHCGIADLAALAQCFSGRAGVFFDTSVWSTLDVLDLLRLVPPEQVLWASDYPYGSHPTSLFLALRAARLARLDDAQLRGLLGRTARRIAAGEPPPEPTRALGPDGISQPLTLARIHQYLSMATPLLWTRQPDTIGVLGLALNACYEPASHPEETRQIEELLVAARDLWRTLPETDDEAEARRVARAAFRLLHFASIISVTTDA